MPSENRTPTASGKTSPWKRRSLIAALFCAGIAACGQDSPTRVEIKVAQSTVKNNQEFLVSTTLRNVGTDEQSMRIWSCSYPQQWIADNPAVHIAGAACKKNDVFRVRLKPGETYERALSIHIKVAAQRLAQKPVTFRLGFEPANYEKTGVGSPLWSNAITVDVTE